MISAIVGLATAIASSSEPALSLDPQQHVLAKDLWKTLNACYEIPTSIELDLRNYPSDLDAADALVWRRAEGPSASTKEARHLRSVESALLAFNQAVSAAPKRDKSKPWSPLVFDQAAGVIRHKDTSGFVHTCKKVNRSDQDQTVALDDWIHGCVADAKASGDDIEVDYRGFHTNVLLPAGSGKTLFEAVNELPYPWAFNCTHYRATETEEPEDTCFLGSLPIHFLNWEGRLLILESQARTGPTGCRGLP